MICCRSIASSLLFVSVPLWSAPKTEKLKTGKPVKLHQIASSGCSKKPAIFFLFFWPRFVIGYLCAFNSCPFPSRRLSFLPVLLVYPPSCTRFLSPPLSIFPFSRPIFKLTLQTTRSSPTSIYPLLQSSPLIVINPAPTCPHPVFSKA